MAADRDVILQRRARFIAAALAPVSVATTGLLPACDEPHKPSANADGTGGYPSYSCFTPATTSTTKPSPPVDQSSSCADAVTIWDDHDLAGNFDAIGDADYFRFFSKKNQWLEILVGAGEPLDPTVMLFSADGSVQLAADDDGWWWGWYGLYSTMVFRTPYDGGYCMEVRNLAAPPWSAGNFSGFVAPIPAPDDARYTEELEPNDSHGSAHAPEKPIVLGMLSPGTDVDVYKLDAPPILPSHAFISVSPSAPQGWGSTSGLGIVSVFDEDDTLVARLDGQLGFTRFTAVPVEPAKSYYLEVHRADTVQGENDFYAMVWQFLELDSELEDGSNDVASGAEPLSDFYGLVNAFHGTVPPGDVDWLDIGAAKPGERFHLQCASARTGSGVADLTVSLFDDPDAAPLQSEQESETQDLVWADSPKWKASMPPVTATKAGVHYLKIESTAAIEAGPSSYHYVCVVNLEPPAP